MRSPPSAGDGLSGWPARAWTAAWPAALALGLGAEWLARSGQSLPAAAADLAVGWTLIGCGLLMWSHRPQGSVGPLLALAGFAWFLGTLGRASQISTLATVGSALVLLHRGPLCHAIIGYPAGRRSGRLRTRVLILGGVYAAAISWAGNDVVTLGVAVLVVAATAHEFARAAGPDRWARATAVAAAAVLAVPLAGGSLVRLLGMDQTALLWVYDAALVVIAVG